MNPCRRCGGLVIEEYDEVRCLICGDRPIVPLYEPGLEMRRTYGPNDCTVCGEPRTKHNTLCRRCAMKEGFAQARGRG